MLLDATDREILATLQREARISNRVPLERQGSRPKSAIPEQKCGRLWLNEGSCVRLRAERRNHVWAYDFFEHRTHDGRKMRMLCVVDEYMREALPIRVARRLRSSDVIDVPADLMLTRGAPKHVRSDNGSEFAATAVREWIAGVGSKTALIELGSPWENGYVESFNGKLPRIDVPDPFVDTLEATLFARASGALHWRCGRGLRRRKRPFEGEEKSRPQCLPDSLNEPIEQARAQRLVGERLA